MCGYSQEQKLFTGKSLTPPRQTNARPLPIHIRGAELDVLVCVFVHPARIIVRLVLPFYTYRYDSYGPRERSG